MSSKSNAYWRKREAEALKGYIKDEKEYDKQVKKIYQNQLDAIQTQINAFYGTYAAKEGITIAEAKKRVSKLDIAEYERKAAKYVKEKDFSAKANEEMRLYNATMKINRLEMLKANIGLEMLAGTDELDRFMSKILKGRTEAELKRQAGILGKTIKNNARLVDSVVNASFHNATFSDRIWTNQALLRNRLSGLLQSGMIQGKNPRVLARDIKKAFNSSTYDAERLMRTELARVQTEAQKQSFERNGFEQYEFIANSSCCSDCQALNGKHFYVKDMMPGENAAPIHPHCRCSVAAWEDDAEYEAWLDYLDNGGTTAEWNAMTQRERDKWTQLVSGSQSYKAVTLNNADKINTSYKNLDCTATKATGYDKDFYISDRIKLKPKQLDYVNTRINEAIKLIGAKSYYKIPRIIICDPTELPIKTVASYTAADNTLRLSKILTSKRGILGLPPNGICDDNPNSIYVHELFHWADTQEYIKKYGTVAGYLESNIKRSKKYVDRLEKAGYNIHDLSKYASSMMYIGRYDEVWTEYRLKKILEK